MCAHTENIPGKCMNYRCLLLLLEVNMVVRAKETPLFVVSSFEYFPFRYDQVVLQSFKKWKLDGCKIYAFLQQFHVPGDELTQVFTKGHSCAHTAMRTRVTVPTHLLPPHPAQAWELHGHTSFPVSFPALTCGFTQTAPGPAGYRLSETVAHSQGSVFADSWLAFLLSWQQVRIFLENSVSSSFLPLTSSNALWRGSFRLVTGARDTRNVSLYRTFCRKNLGVHGIHEIQHFYFHLILELKCIKW